MDFIGSIFFSINAFVIVLTISFTGLLNSLFALVSLQMSMTLVNVFNKILLNYGTWETVMTSSQRLLQYVNLRTEMCLKRDEDPDNYPPDGSIEF
jgi:hypothetical protein